MLQRIKEMIQVLPPAYGSIIKFACLTGLRPAEAAEAVKLINDKDKSQMYYKPERNALEHFHFPDIFFRQTKKAYISFVSPEMLLEIVKDDGIKSPHHLQLHQSCSLEQRYEAGHALLPQDLCFASKTIRNRV